MCIGHRSGAWIIGWVSRRYQTSCLLDKTNAGRYVPFPAVITVRRIVRDRTLRKLAYQHPPSHQMSKEPSATYARSSTADPKLRTPCTWPPFPALLPNSAARLKKLPTFRWRFPSGTSLRSLPHSHERMQPLGAASGSGGIGDRSRGSRVVSLSQAPFPRQAVNLCRRMLVDPDARSQSLGHIQLPKEWCINGSNYWLTVPDKGDRHTVKWTEMYEVHGTYDS